LFWCLLTSFTYSQITAAALAGTVMDKSVVLENGQRGRTPGVDDYCS